MNGRHCSYVEGDRQDGLGECVPEHCAAAAAGTPCPFLSEPCPWTSPCRYIEMRPDGHLGAHVWKNEAELAWECADDCSHPAHDHERAL